MLVKNVEGEMRAGSMLENSDYYIEIAKFSQAYTTIIKNPNVFLKEIGEPEISAKEKITWGQLVKILQTCDLGFKSPPTETEILVYYNYALEMGSVENFEKKIASVSEVAEAQKHFYNFVDESASRAELLYLKQHQIALNREREFKEVDNKLSKLKAKNLTTIILMVVGVVCLLFGVFSFLVENAFASLIGGVVNVWDANYVGATFFVVLGLILFAIGSRFYVSTRYNYLKFKDASKSVTGRYNRVYNEEVALKRKFDILKKDLKTIRIELADETKSKDVANVVEKLVVSNRFYKQLVSVDELGFSTEQIQVSRSTDDDFAPIKLTKEQEENLNHVSKEAIILEGQLDSEAYNEKFEKPGRKKKTKQEKVDEKESEQAKKHDEKFAEQEAKIEEKMKEKTLELERQRQLEEEEKRKKEAEKLSEDVGKIKEMLGIGKEKDLG